MLKGTVMQKKLVFECFWNAWHGSAIEMFMARMKNGIAWLHVCCFWETTFLRSLTVLMCDIMLSNRKTSICDIVCCLRENYWIVWVRPFQCIYIVWIQTCCVVCEKTNRHSIARIFISRSGSKIVFLWASWYWEEARLWGIQQVCNWIHQLSQRSPLRRIWHSENETIKSQKWKIHDSVLERSTLRKMNSKKKT